MATTQSIRALANYQYMHDGRFPGHLPQKHVQTKLEKYAMAMRYATGIVEYYKENYSYPEVQYQMSENFKNGGRFDDNLVGN